MRRLPTSLPLSLSATTRLEYSDELVEELELDADSYPFVDKEPEVRDFFFIFQNLYPSLDYVHLFN